MHPENVNHILELHKLWLSGDKTGVCADFRNANLRDTDLRGVNLEGANLRNADLRWANLKNASLPGANLRFANLRYVNLHGADLEGANLHGADLWGADLRGVNLEGANLHGAGLGYAVLTDRKMIHLDINRQHLLYVLPKVKDGPRFIAGCRNFTYSEAIEHWTTFSAQPDYVTAIEKYMRK